MDNDIKKKKEDISNIELRLRIMTLAVTFLNAIIALTSFIDTVSYNVSLSTFVVLMSVLLIYSVCRLSRMIKYLKHAFPNERFIDAHYCTFTFFILIYVPSTLLTMLTGIG